MNKHFILNTILPLLATLFLLMDIWWVQNYAFVYPTHPFFLWLFCILFIPAIAGHLSNSSKIKKIFILMVLTIVGILLVTSLYYLFINEVTSRKIAKLTVFLIVPYLLISYLLPYLTPIKAFFQKYSSQTTVYLLASIPLIIFLFFLFPGSVNHYDTRTVLFTSIGKFAITNWYSSFLQHILRVLFFFHIHWGVIFLFQSLCYILSCILLTHFIANTLRYRLLIYIILLYVPSFSILLYAPTLRDGTAAIFQLLAISSILYYSKARQAPFLFIALVSTVIAIFSRQNQITMAIVFIFPLIYFFFQHYKSTQLSTFRTFILSILLAISIFSFDKFINNNSLRVTQLSPFLGAQGFVDIFNMYLISGKKDGMIPEGIKKQLTATNQMAAIQKLNNAWEFLNLVMYSVNLKIDTYLHHIIAHPKEYFQARRNVLNNFLYHTIFQFYTIIDDSKDINNFKEIEIEKMNLNPFHRFVFEYYWKVHSSIRSYPFVFMSIFLLLFSWMKNKWNILPLPSKENNDFVFIYYLSTSVFMLLIPLVFTTGLGIEMRYIVAIPFVTSLALLILIKHYVEKYQQRNSKTQG